MVIALGLPEAEAEADAASPLLPTHLECRSETGGRACVSCGTQLRLASPL